MKVPPCCSLLKSASLSAEGEPWLPTAAHSCAGAVPAVLLALSSLHLSALTALSSLSPAL